MQCPCVNHNHTPHDIHAPTPEIPFLAANIFGFGMDINFRRNCHRPTARARANDLGAHRISDCAEKFALGKAALCAVDQAPSRIWRVDALVAAAEQGQSATAFAADKGRYFASVSAR